MAQKVFESIYRAHRDYVYGFALRLTGFDPDAAEELTQESFYRAFVALPRFRGDCDVRTWLCQIMKHTFYKQLRKARTRQRAALPGTKRIAGPGCNVTATTLALQPGIAEGLVESQDIVADLVVGYSGAGKNLKRTNLLAAEALQSALPYSVGGKHRHIPEILQNFAHAAGKSAAEASEFTLGFTPILAPMSRGILATVSARMTDKAKALSDEEIRAVWSKAYEGQDFMVLLPEGTLPATGNIIGSNAAHLQVVTDRKAGRIYAFAAIDNLNRGTAGQAVQSLNIALGLPEDAGLTKIGVAP